MRREKVGVAPIIELVETHLKWLGHVQRSIKALVRRGDQMTIIL